MLVRSIDLTLLTRHSDVKNTLTQPEVELSFAEESPKDKDENLDLRRTGRRVDLAPDAIGIQCKNQMVKLSVMYRGTDARYYLSELLQMSLAYTRLAPVRFSCTRRIKFDRTTVHFVRQCGKGNLPEIDCSRAHGSDRTRRCVQLATVSIRSIQSESLSVIYFLYSIIFFAYQKENSSINM